MSSLPITVRSLRVLNFKRFEDFKIIFQNINVLVGVNNSGKSSILLAVRSFFNFLAELIKEREKLDNESSRAAVDIDYLNLPDVREAWHRKRQRTSNRKIIPVIFIVEFSNNLTIEIHLRQFYGQPHISIQNLSQDIPKSEILKILDSNPILVPGFVGALVIEEYMTPQVVKRVIDAGRQTEVLRNVLLKLNTEFPKRFELLNAIIQKHFNVNLSKISFDEANDEFVTTEYKESGVELDIVMAGSGFLQFLQLLTFILSKKSNIVLLDEPDAHLHPSLQKILILVLTELSKQESIQFIIATHSKEIVNQTNPTNIVFIDSKNKEGKRLLSTSGVLDVLEKLGSIDHVDLALLLKTKRCLFVEGHEFKILQHFANTLSIPAFQGNKQVVPIIRGGKGERYYDDLTVFRSVVGLDLKGYSIIDRDFKTDDQVQDLIQKSKKKQVTTHVWRLHEIENYLLKPSVIIKVINRKNTTPQISESDVKNLILESSNELRQDIADNLSEALIHSSRQKGNTLDVSTSNKRARETLASKWDNWYSLLEIIPGKEVLRKVKQRIQSSCQVSFSDLELASEFASDEIDDEVKQVLSAISSM